MTTIRKSTTTTMDDDYHGDDHDCDGYEDDASAPFSMDDLLAGKVPGASAS